MRSLASRLLALWAMSLLACAAVAFLLLRLHDQSATARVQRAEAVVAAACGLIRDRYSFYVAGWPGGPLDDATRAGLADVTAAALADEPGVEGGIWQNDASLAYAFPTYGGARKTDLPPAELPRIASANRAARAEDAPISRSAASGSETILLAACPLPGPLDSLTAWAMTRVRPVSGLGPLRAGLGVLLALVAGMSAWLAWLALSWRRSLRAIESALLAHDAGALPELPPTGERELDRIVAALNDTGRRLADSRATADALARQVAASERLAALGRVAAGVAHEVRNPLAAMRIRAESALRGDDARRARALPVILDQIARLDRLVTELLAMTQRRAPNPADTALPALLESVAAAHRPQAAEAGVALQVDAADTRATLDPDLLARALENLVLNAVQHTPPGGTVTLSAAPAPGGRLHVEVRDTGPGVAPALRDTLFEPFVTARPGGTGLGLPIARELVDAMGGRLALLPADGPGARFLVDLP
ncbi:MAG: sensor histidine kinase [Janthinobacterium lividum]